MKNLILAAAIAATTMASVAFADTIVVENHAWYTADVTVTAGDDFKQTKDGLLLGESWSVEAPDGWQVQIHAESSRNAEAPDGTKFINDDGTNGAVIQSHGTTFNPTMKVTQRFL